jgi:hypothetical protein
MLARSAAGEASRTTNRNESEARMGPDLSQNGVPRARVDTVRRLEAAVRSGPEPEERDLHRLRIGLPPEGAEVVECALEVAGVLSGLTTPLWRSPCTPS